MTNEEVIEHWNQKKQDNPVEVIFEWAEDSSHTEDLQDDEDDWCADCDHENDDCMCPNEEA